ncbi:hypothetical protein H9660_12755 [Clostridium sp. Sa3CUN1]|uniref:Lipoprotein n=1 Tax=Clostridium gallinarum TaxID=2762246 RepID=A0ABR8Q6H5_9CLOT|nr:hypothetical protein [Clostridium gallinarum]MBD7916017.1 hypothetical protein [Clostridium gallinarum]
MKKIFSLIMEILLSIVLISCNTTKVLEENTKENNESSKYIITERNVENNIKDSRIYPRFYYDNILYVNMIPSKNGDPLSNFNLYFLDNEEAFKKVEEEKFTEEEIDFLNNFNGDSGSGIYMVDSSKLSERKFYYIDIINKTKFELRGFEKDYSNIEYKFKRFIEYGFSVPNNDNYYIQNYLATKNEANSPADEFIIIDIKNQRYYLSNNDKKIKSFYYDNNLNLIIGIDEAGTMYQIILDENGVNFEEYKSIDTEKLNLNGRKLNFVSKLSNDKLLFNIGETKYIKDNDGVDIVYTFESVIYNIKSGEINYLDKEKSIAGKFNSKFYDIYYKDERYLGEISEDGNITLVYKLNDQEEYIYNYVLSNKEGTKIFLTKLKYSKEILKNPDKPIADEEIKYSILEIEER